MRVGGQSLVFLSGGSGVKGLGPREVHDHLGECAGVGNSSISFSEVGLFENGVGRSEFPRFGSRCMGVGGGRREGGRGLFSQCGGEGPWSLVDREGGCLGGRLACTREAA